MGIFTSLLAPLLKSAAVAGTAMIPGAGPILAPIVGGALTAGQSAMSGQGPLSSLANGAISGGMQVGMGQLGGLMDGGQGTADTSNLGKNVSLADPNMFGQGGDALTNWAQEDLMKKLATRNSFMIGGGGF